MKKTTQKKWSIPHHGKFGKKKFNDFFSTEKFVLGIWKLIILVKFSDYQMFVVNIFVIYDAFPCIVPVDALTF